jgi:hypothetical protein
MLDVRNHLNACESCKQEADELRSLKSILGNMPEVQPDEEFRLKLHISLAGLHNQSRPFLAPQVAPKSDQTAFDVSRDQAYQAGGDVFNDGSFIITASAPSNGSR